MIGVAEEVAALTVGLGTEAEACLTGVVDLEAEVGTCTGVVVEAHLSPQASEDVEAMTAPSGAEALLKEASEDVVLLEDNPAMMEVVEVDSRSEGSVPQGALTVVLPSNEPAWTVTTTLGMVVAMVVAEVDTPLVAMMVGTAAEVVEETILQWAALEVEDMTPTSQVDQVTMGTVEGEVVATAAVVELVATLEVVEVAVAMKEATTARAVTVVERIEASSQLSATVTMIFSFILIIMLDHYHSSPLSFCLFHLLLFTFSLAFHLFSCSIHNGLFSIFTFILSQDARLCYNFWSKNSSLLESECTTFIKLRIEI